MPEEVIRESLFQKFRVSFYSRKFLSLKYLYLVVWPIKKSKTTKMNYGKHN